MKAPGTAKLELPAHVCRCRATLALLVTLPIPMLITCAWAVVVAVVTMSQGADAQVNPPPPPGFEPCAVRPTVGASVSVHSSTRDCSAQYINRFGM